LAQVDYDVDVAPPVNYLSPVVQCDLMVGLMAAVYSFTLQSSQLYRYSQQEYVKP
jgi:hypothetical protein